MMLMLMLLFRSNPLGARGNLAQRYGELVKDLWSASARSIAPLKLRVNLHFHFTLFIHVLTTYAEFCSARKMQHTVVLPFTAAVQ